MNIERCNKLLSEIENNVKAIKQEFEQIDQVLFETTDRRQERLEQIKQFLRGKAIKYTTKSRKGLDGLFVKIDGKKCDIAGYTFDTVKTLFAGNGSQKA